MSDVDFAQSDVLERMRSYDPPAEGFDPHTAPDELLRQHGLPRRPDPETEPELARLFKRAFIRPNEYIKAELAIDPVMSDRDPLGRRDLDFKPTGWGGAIVTLPSLEYSPPEPANMVFAEWVVPVILPVDPAPLDSITVGFWVGLDGFSNRQVLQAGIAATLTPEWWFFDLTPPIVSWWAWTEWYTDQYKDPAVQISNFAVDTGNTVSFMVCAPEPDQGAVTMQNVSTRQLTSVGMKARPGITSEGASAEWIVEGPSDYLPNFSAILFNTCCGATQHHLFDLSTCIVTNIAGSGGAPLTNASISSPTAAVVLWDGYS
jgi:hypothetical protein